jgi:hypothetical protein
MKPARERDGSGTYAGDRNMTLSDLRLACGARLGRVRGLADASDDQSPEDVPGPNDRYFFLRAAFFFVPFLAAFFFAAFFFFAISDHLLKTLTSSCEATLHATIRSGRWTSRPDQRPPDARKRPPLVAEMYQASAMPRGGSDPPHRKQTDVIKRFKRSAACPGSARGVGTTAWKSAVSVYFRGGWTISPCANRCCTSD